MLIVIVVVLVVCFDVSVLIMLVNDVFVFVDVFKYDVYVDKVVFFGNGDSLCVFGVVLFIVFVLFVLLVLLFFVVVF